MSRLPLTLLPFVSVLSLSSFAAHGAGFALIENSASGMGNAYAGAGAIAEDGSTIYFNPAGMTELEGTRLTGALHWVRPRGEFTNDGSTVAPASGGGSLSGGNGGNNGVDAIIPNLYYSKEVNDGVVFGLGINVPFGMETNYDKDWVGRYHAVGSKVMSVNINPSLAWKINDKLSFGAGINGQYIQVELISAIDFGAVCQAQELGGIIPANTCSGIGANPQQMDGFIKLDADDFSWGYNFGLLYKPRLGTHIGLSYRSKITHTVSGDADFTVPSAVSFLTSSNRFVDTTLRSSVSLPESSSFSLSHQIGQFTLLFDWTYTRWSRFKELRIEYDSSQPDSVTTENWGDSNRYAIGLNYQLNPRLLLRSGLAYDETPIPSGEYRTPRIPGNDRLWLAFGFGYQIDEQLSFDLGYAHLFVDDSDSDHAFESSVPTLEHNLKGEYSARVDILSLQLNWQY